MGPSMKRTSGSGSRALSKQKSPFRLKDKLSSDRYMESASLLNLTPELRSWCTTWTKSM